MGGYINIYGASLVAQNVKNLPVMQETCVGKIWRREWLPTPVGRILPGEFCEQGSLMGYSPWGLKESNPDDWLTP